MSPSIDFLAAIERESRRFDACLADADPEARVPTCPGWSAADLLWHLAEVQTFWANIVRSRLSAPDTAKVDESNRPAAYPDLVEFAARATVELVESLASCDPTTSVWTWCDDDQTAGFVLRRQAHEALIHRLDAELTVGRSSPIDSPLAADGIDEALTVMFGEAPAWGELVRSGAVGHVSTTDVDRSWGVELCRFVGTSPDTGTAYDEGVLAAVDALTSPEFTLVGAAGTLDAWLWNRPTIDQVSLTGRPEAVAGFTAIVRGGVQ